MVFKGRYARFVVWLSSRLLRLTGSHSYIIYTRDGDKNDRVSAVYGDTRSSILGDAFIMTRDIVSKLEPEEQRTSYRLLSEFNHKEYLKLKGDTMNINKDFDINTIPGVADFKQKPNIKRAVQMDADFSVETLEGVMTGKSGDYLIRGLKGELYPCDRDIFEKSYDKI